MDAITVHVKARVRTHAPGLVKLVRTIKGRSLPGKDRKERFTWVYDTNQWADPVSVSGRGSNPVSTARLVELLPDLIRRHGITSIVDAPCGDMTWMPQVLDRLARDGAPMRYVGLDIVDALIVRNRAVFSDREWTFEVADLVVNPLPAADLVLVRDCFVHLPNADVTAALANVIRSGSTWLLTTGYVDHPVNTDAVAGQWRTLDLRRPPFSLPDPVEIVDDASPLESADLQDKRMMLWRIADIAAVLARR
jgi:hypothetical protein